MTAPIDVLAALPPDHPFARHSDGAGRIAPPPFDVEGYLDSLDRCRSKFPGLKIFSGLEIGEPHRHQEAVAAVLALAPFDLVLGSLHTLASDDGFEEPGELFERRQAGDVMRDYLAEIARLAAHGDVFSVLGHIDFPVRYWPDGAAAFDPASFETEFRDALRATAGSGRSLEINTVLPLHVQVVRWWIEEGGETVTFGSDAHSPGELLRNFVDAAAMAESLGFRPSKDLFSPWSLT